jgi:glycosyltransferase involved in cell wall biosynthesis
MKLLRSLTSAVPFFTIITATRNAATSLPRLLESLASQTCRDFELILQDGASTDGTVAVVERWRGRLPALRIASEPDTGIYDAWNKALQRIQGQWVLFLGADDSLYGPDALARVQVWLKDCLHHIVFAGCSLALTTPHGIPVEVWHPGKTPVADLPNGMPLPYPALFHRRSLFAKEVFSTAFQIAGDYDFLCRNLSDANYAVSELLISRMSVGGRSASLPEMLSSELECLRVSRRYFPTAWRPALYARICRSALFRAMHKLLGLKAALRFADAIRWCRRKPPLWTRRDAPVPMPLEQGDAFPSFSLLVATLDRIEPLRGLLASLTEQTCRDFEILIADQNPPGFLDDLCAEFQNSLPLRVISVPNKGLSAARNALLPHARGSFIAFPDDDCWYAPDTLGLAAAFFAANPHVHVLLGQWHDPAGSLQPRPERPGHAVIRFSAFRHAGTLVQFYRKAVVDVVGGFDPELGPGTGLPYGCGEDTDYLLRVLAAGFSAVSAPSVQVCHPDISRIPSSSEKIRSYAMGRMHLLRKHKFPLWFKLAHVIYPLFRIPFEGRKTWTYRTSMFLGRLAGLLRTSSQSVR